MKTKPKFKPLSIYYQAELINSTTIDIRLNISYEINYPRNNSFSNNHYGAFNNKIARFILERDISETEFERYSKLIQDHYKVSAFTTISHFHTLLTKKFKINSKYIELSTDEKGSFYFDSKLGRVTVD